jgi:hypothetical protein
MATYDEGPADGTGEALCALSKAGSVAGTEYLTGGKSEQDLTLASRFPILARHWGLPQHWRPEGPQVSQ